MMMRRVIQSSLSTALLSGLMLTACGGPEEATGPSEEALGTQEAALCSGSSVSSLVISGASSWGGELAGAANWTVTYPSNGAHLDLYVDGVLRSSTEVQGDVNRSGTWYFSYSPMSCGSHNVQVKAYPMVFGSNGSKEWCQTSGPQAKTTTVTQSCPTASLSCSRSGSYVNCTSSGSGGTGSPYSMSWQYQAWNDAGSEHTSPWSSGTSTRSYYCPSTTLIFPADWLEISVKVKDNSGMWSPASMPATFICKAGTYFEVPPGW